MNFAGVQAMNLGTEMAAVNAPGFKMGAIQNTPLQNLKYEMAAVNAPGFKMGAIQNSLQNLKTEVAAVNVATPFVPVASVTAVQTLPLVAVTATEYKDLQNLGFNPIKKFQ